MTNKLALALFSAVITVGLLGIHDGGTNGTNNAWAKPSAKASGEFVKKTYKTKGHWRLVKEGDKRFLELSDDFKTTRGPDLKVFLSPTSLSKVSDKNAEKGSLFVGPLPSHKGKQRIELPAGAKLTDYKSVLIHCQQYTVLFAASSIR